MKINKQNADNYQTDYTVAGSFRDPSGFVFVKDATIYRQINQVYRQSYDTLMRSGLYDSLIEQQLLVPFTEVDIEDLARTPDAYIIVKPKKIPFIAYPYEFCFSQLKDSALSTLAIQKKALDFGMSLKDCSAYNIQFVDGKPMLMDSLSFEVYREGMPWVAYKQFCQHFLAPLVLMAHTDIRLGRLLRVYIDGIPLDLASDLLPVKTKFSLGLLTHIHLHAKTQQKYADKQLTSYQRKKKISCTALRGIIDNLETTVRKLTWTCTATEWADYYDKTNYSDSSFKKKQAIVNEYIDIIKPSVVWDLGANTGVFSRVASMARIRTVAFDIDPASVELNYLTAKKHAEINILPLLLDLTNPSPSIGWANSERLSIIERSEDDTVLALALIHHLALSNNVPLERIAEFLALLGSNLIIEFIPKQDSQVQKLLATRDDIFINYHQAGFEQMFSLYYNIIRKDRLEDSERTLYLLKRRDSV